MALKWHASGVGRKSASGSRFGGFGWPVVTVLSRGGADMLPASDHGEPAGWIEAIATRGDRAAFAALFGYYAPRIKGFLIRTGTVSEIAEELAQETMLLVWRKAGLFDASQGSPAAWIYAIARNLRIDRFRRERAVKAEILYQVLRSDEPGPDQTIESLDLDDHIRDALSKLPSEQAEVVRLSFYEDKPHGDIARILNIPLGTVKSRLRLAMSKLRQDMGERT
jgi:RNA polymerase sigma-70 factor, ECF subfamily